jgi:hypothetical protein
MEMNRIFYKSMGSDYQGSFSRFESLLGSFFLLSCQTSYKKVNRNTMSPKGFFPGFKVLSRENFCRSHDGNLNIFFYNCMKGSEKCDNGFSGSYIPLEKA